MAISKLLRNRIAHDAKAPDFWSVPKGQAVHPENWQRIAAQLQVLTEFETIPWSQAQAKFAKALLNRDLIDPYQDHKKGFSAVARMQFPVWRLLGLAWINTKKEPEITEIGRQFVGAKSISLRRQILASQLHRYQFYNPTLPPYFGNFRTFPVLALYRLLSHVDWHIDRDELALFGTRIRSFSDADGLAALVDEWRSLTQGERETLLAVAQTITAESHTKSQEGTTWRKVENDLAYLLAVLRIVPTMEQSEKGLSVVPDARRLVQRMLLGAAKSAEFVDYESEQDWLAVYGQPVPANRADSPWTTAAEARTYYERIGRIDAATEAFAREQQRSAGEIEEYRSVQVLERVLEDLLAQNLGTLEEGLELVGRQHPTPVGKIDLLARDQSGIYVVIELKRGRSGDKVVGQIARYMTWVVNRLCQGKNDKARGMIVAKDFDKKYSSAIAPLKRAIHVTSYTYDLKVRFNIWEENES